jgi:exodeoxyribonuclease-3
VRRGFDDEPRFPTDELPPEARAMAATVNGVRVWSVYVPNGREVDSDHYAYKLRWLDALAGTLEREVATYEKFVVMGDFNIAPTDADVWDPAVFVTSTHVTEPERAAYRRIVDLGLVDLEARALKGDHPFTYWDYRAGSFHKGMGMRIDLVLASKAVATAVTDAYVDREARKGKGPSDHAPVVVDVDL